MDEQTQADDGRAAPPVPQRPRDELGRALLKRALAEIYTPRAAPVVFDGKRKELYPFTRETIGDVALTYLEFGVFRGNSMRKMTRLFTNADARFFGFDSFQGLPEDWIEKQKEHFSTEGKAPNIRDPRVNFVTGYFQNTVPDFLSSHRFQTPVLVQFDADIYSATLFLLTTLWHHIPEYYFLFDEFFPDEAVAMYDFALAYPVEFRFLACSAPDANPKRPSKVFGHMKRVAYTP